ncbi:MAG: hypothetical protein Q4G42_00425 [Neisseria sp.]|nr:hypothetical protein [Neisseria sp.]
MLQKNDLKQISEFMQLLLDAEGITIDTAPVSSGHFTLRGKQTIGFDDIRRRYPLVNLYVQKTDDGTDLYWRALRQLGVQRQVQVFATYRQQQNILSLHPPLANLHRDLHIARPFTMTTDKQQLTVDNCLSADQIAQLQEKLHYRSAYRSETSGSRFYLPGVAM